MRFRRTAPSNHREGGYAAVLTALILVPLLGFAGFAVDVGAWYGQASSLQRAADAAALAGVIYSPTSPTRKLPHAPSRPATDSPTASTASR